jgi:hypothetical protein
MLLAIGPGTIGGRSTAQRKNTYPLSNPTLRSIAVGALSSANCLSRARDRFALSTLAPTPTATQSCASLWRRGSLTQPGRRRISQNGATDEPERKTSLAEVVQEPPPQNERTSSRSVHGSKHAQGPAGGTWHAYS